MRENSKNKYSCILKDMEAILKSKMQQSISAYQTAKTLLYWLGDNKRLGTVLKLAQARVQEQLRAINPVLANPEEFRASLRR